jgi:hypothetical protein
MTRRAVALQLDKQEFGLTPDLQRYWNTQIAVLFSRQHNAIQTNHAFDKALTKAKKHDRGDRTLGRAHLSSSNVRYVAAADCIKLKSMGLGRPPVA